MNITTTREERAKRLGNRAARRLFWTLISLLAGLFLGMPASSQVQDINDSYHAYRTLQTSKQLSDFLDNNPRHPETAKIREAFDISLGRSVITLVKDGHLEVEGRGVDIQRAVLRVRRRVPHHVTAIIPKGSYLKSRQTAIQNMIVIKEEKVRIITDGWVEVPLMVACANRDRAEPTSTTRFDLQSGPEAQALFRLVAEFDSRASNIRALQQAVWCITDNPSLIESGFLTSRGVEPESANLLAKILLFCHETGVDVHSRRLWHDRAHFLSKVTTLELTHKMEKIP